MSREVRRVPVDWQHPIEPNPYWREQQAHRCLHGAPESRLHAPDARFVSLLDDFPGAVARHVDELSQISRREGFEWTFPLGYHLRGWERDGEWREPVPFSFYAADGETLVEVVLEDEDHLQALLIQQKTDEAPDPADYMPVFDTSADELGWCLYQTVSEGTPVTPVFGTATELVEHLVQHGEDWDQQPYRRAAAEALVLSGSSLASFVMVGGELLDSARDADRIEVLS